jgi:ribosomal protein S15P/S13E
MAKVTNEPMFETLKRIQADLTLTKDGVRELNQQMQAMREHMQAHNKDITNIFNKLVGHELRLERMERRLDLIGEPVG